MADSVVPPEYDDDELEVEELEDAAGGTLRQRVAIQQGRGGRGKLVIAYNSLDDHIVTENTDAYNSLNDHIVTVHIDSYNRERKNVVSGKTVDRTYNGLALDAGPFVRALEYAADREAVVVGKPKYSR